jgi:hypothetical protein
VQPRPPERLVGVDVADAGDEGLVEQGTLDAGVLAPQPGRRALEVVARVQRVAGDVRDRGGHRLELPRRYQRLQGEAAEGALVDEPQLGVAVDKAEPHPQVHLRGRGRRLHQQLTAHAQVHDERLVRHLRAALRPISTGRLRRVGRRAVNAGREVEPQVLATTPDVDHGATAKA